MNARKSRRSRSVQLDRERSRFGLSRPSLIRNALPILEVVCDDSKTAVAYFELIKREVKAKLTLHIERNPCATATAADVVKLAVARRDSLQKDASRDDDDKTAVFALIDLEHESERQDKAYAAQKTGESAGITVALSKPCYEVWTLLHLVDTGELFENCATVLRQVQGEWKKEFDQEFGKKGQADYSKIVGRRAEAAKRAKYRRERDDPSWTEVYKVIEQIDLFCNPSPPKP